MSNPFMSVFTDTADFSVDNELSTEMITVPREEWEWRERLINFQYRMYRELLDEYDKMRQERDWR